MAYSNLNGSANAFVLALSPTTINAAAASTDPFDFSDFTHLTAVVHSNSGGTTFSLVRSATSDGTFSEFGASIPIAASGISVRTVVAQSSAVWYSVAYGQLTVSATPTILLIGQGSRKIPIGSQLSGTTVYSDVA